jgi:hypothetical protein
VEIGVVIKNKNGQVARGKEEGEEGGLFKKL